MDSLKEKIEAALASAEGTLTETTESEVVDGTLEVEGNATMKKNLRVEGFLDAPNIRGCSKGLYRTREQLLAKYPRPHEGWWAVVANWEKMDAEVGDGDGTETTTVVTYDSVLYIVQLDEYQRPYWYNTGKVVALDGLINQFGDIDNMWAAIKEMNEKYSTWLETLDEWVQEAYDEVTAELDYVRRALVISAEGVDSGILHLDARLQDILDPDDPTKRQGQLIEVSGRVDTSGIEKNITTAQETADKAVANAAKAQEGVDKINETLSDYPEEKEKWDNVSRQIKSGRINNGTERFDGVVCSDMDKTDEGYVAVEIYDDMSGDPAEPEAYAGVIWLCVEKMFVAYNTYAVTPSGGGDPYPLYRCYKHWDMDYEYMETPGAQNGLWKDKIYLGEGHLWYWMRCNQTLCLASGSGDIELVSYEEIDEELAKFQFVEPTAAGVSSISVEAAQPLVGSATAPDEQGAVKVILSITEVTDKEINEITGKEE